MNKCEVIAFLVLVGALWGAAYQCSREPDLPPAPCVMETPHPCQPGQVYTYTHTAAQNVFQMAVHFSRVILGEGDVLRVTDAEGEVWWDMGGPASKDDFYSLPVPGNVVSVVLDSDSGPWGVCVMGFATYQVALPTATCEPMPTYTLYPTHVPLPTYTALPTYTPAPLPPTVTPLPQSPLCQPCVPGQEEPEGYWCRECTGLGPVLVRKSSPNADCQWCKYELEGWASFYASKFIGRVRRDGTVYDGMDDGCAVRGDLYPGLAGVTLKVCKATNPHACIYCTVRDSGDTELWKERGVVVDLPPYLAAMLMSLDQGLVRVTVEVAR